jgi:hypothetical protein
MNDIPSLMNLIDLWLKEVLPDRAFDVVNFTQIRRDREWYLFSLRSRHIGYIYDDFIILFNGVKIYAADPKFFDKLGCYILKRIKEPAGSI